MVSRAFLFVWFLVLSNMSLSKSIGSVSELLRKYERDIEQLKEEAFKVVSPTVEPYSNDVFFLRYCLEWENQSERSKFLAENLAWRQGTEGKTICETALKSVQAATAARGWNNEIVRLAAPYSDPISNFITPHNQMTVISNSGDLIQCIRAGHIDDVGLMKAVSEVQMIEFLMYSKEVHALMANRRSTSSDMLVRVMTANDLSGVKMLGSSGEFRSALSKSTKRGATLYPMTAGPTVLLNLPMLMGALVKLFTPLFPSSVNQRIRFAKSVVMQNINSLTQVGSDSADRSAFLKEVDIMLSDK